MSYDEIIFIAIDGRAAPDDVCSFVAQELLVHPFLRPQAAVPLLTAAPGDLIGLTKDQLRTLLAEVA